jgi:CheY-like chemotaxis protein
MSDSESQSTESTQPAMRRLERVRLAGFSARDGELFKLFLRRPPGAGNSLQVVDADPDLLIANLSTPGTEAIVAQHGNPATTIGLVSRYASDAPYYQILQDSQLLYSLAQAINRIREGWEPPSRIATSTMSTDSVNSPNGEIGTTASQNGEDREAKAESAADNSSTVTTPSTDNLPWQRQLSILVVDDSKFSRAAIAEALTKVGFVVDTAVDGEDGLRMAKLKRYDVGVVDFEMPGMRGPEVIRKMRGLHGTAPQILIMLTSRTGAVDRLRAKVAGCDAYLTKPTKMSEFIAVLTQFANAGKLTRQ